MKSFRTEIKLARDSGWTFVAECFTVDEAWNAVGAFACDYYAAQVIWPTDEVWRSAKDKDA